MFKHPKALSQELNILEDVERASLRLVTQAVVDFRREAAEIFAAERDLQADIGEDITREALDSVGVSRIPVRLFGKMDYKRARYVFHPDYAIRQALFVDSKAEKDANSARLQTSQTSLRIKQVRAGQDVDVAGKLPSIITIGGDFYLTTTIFVKYVYKETKRGNRLLRICIACLPNGMLQERYNPSSEKTIWITGPDAPSRGEEFRTRLSFRLLKEKAIWRVQDVQIDPEEPFAWDE